MLAILAYSDFQPPHSSQNLPLSAPDFHPEPFSDELSAVIAATHLYNPVSIKENREYIGAVIKHKHSARYYYSAVAGKAGKNSITATLIRPKGYTLVAFWHTHGAGGDSHLFFSDEDVRLVEQFQRPLYLADSSGYLKKFSPGGKTLSRYQARKQGLRAGKGYAKGTRMKDNNGDFIQIPVY